jgi:hypothetical protein
VPECHSRSRFCHVARPSAVAHLFGVTVIAYTLIMLLAKTPGERRVSAAGNGATHHDASFQEVLFQATFINHQGDCHGSRKAQCLCVPWKYETWAVKYDKAVERLIKDREALLAFFDFPGRRVSAFYAVRRAPPGHEAPAGRWHDASACRLPSSPSMCAKRLSLAPSVVSEQLDATWVSSARSSIASLTSK